MTENMQLIIKDVAYDGFDLKATQNVFDNKIFVGAKWICNGIGLSRGQSNGEIIKIQSDLVLKRGCMKFRAGVFDPNNETIAIMIDYLPLWLAKISITPRMQKETPELVEKLINYQLKAKDVLAAAFLPQPKQQLTKPLLEQSIMRLQSQQGNIIDCLNQQGNAILDLEEQIEELKSNTISKSIELTSTPIELSKKDIIRNIIKPLGQKLHDCSLGYKSTYKKVYLAMNINWKYRLTRWNNLHEDNKAKGKIELVSVDDKLLDLFRNTVTKMLLN